MSTEPLTPYAEFLLREQVRGLEQMLAICRAALSATAAPPPTPQTPAEATAEAATEVLASAVAESVLAEPVPTEPVPTEPVPTEPVPTEPVPTEPVPTEPVQEQVWSTVRRVRPPPKIIGSPINKSQRPLYERSDIVHGEKALATYTAKKNLTAADIDTAEQLIIQRNETEFRGFYHKRSNTLFQSPTAVCATLLIRPDIRTNLHGRSHIWLERGGQWVKLMEVLKHA